MKTAIQLNNNGVFALNRGEDEEFAVRAFIDALGEMKAHVKDNMEIEHQQQKSSSLSSTSQHYYPEDNTMDCVDDASSTLSTGPSYNPFADVRVQAIPCAPISPGHLCYIFNRTISISPTSLCGLESLPVHSSCILLNMAIAYHRMAIKGNHTQLSKAERLYDMIIRMIIPTPLHNHDATMVAIHMIALNNLIDIHHRQSRFDTAKKDIADLSSLIHLHRAASAAHLRGEPSGSVMAQPSRFVLSDCDIDLMTMNVLFWTVPDAAAAA
jgi:hypothetical protein